MSLVHRFQDVLSVILIYIVCFRYFEYQLELAKLTGLPLFLHNRKSTGDLLEILKRNNTNSGLKGVVHSFDGSYDEAKEILMLGFDVGINGW